jgi:hypothetical protein
MDVRRDGFYGTLTLNGKHLLLGDNMCSRGSIMNLVGESLKSLQAERSRLDADGELHITLRLSNKPFDTSREGIMILGKSEEVAALLGNEKGDSPNEGETYEEFYQRLLDLDYPQASAEYIAAQWFGHEVNPTTTLWLNDPKAVRFRVLNSRDEEFEAALPSEYESLKHYVAVTYPEFLHGLVFRTA